MTSLLITNDQLNSWFDFFDSILLIPQWFELAEPYEVRLYINLGVPDKAMFRQPLLGPGRQLVALSKDNALDFGDHL